MYKIQTLQIKQQNKQEKEGQVGKGKVHIFNSFCRMAQKKCKFFLVTVPFVDPIKWGYLHILFINMRIWLNYFDHRWRQFFSFGLWTVNSCLLSAELYDMKTRSCLKLIKNYSELTYSSYHSVCMIWIVPLGDIFLETQHQLVQFYWTNILPIQHFL